MGRRVKMAFIESESSKRAEYNKRRRDMMKDSLATLSKTKIERTIRDIINSGITKKSIA